jgi:hypothetical protein
MSLKQEIGLLINAVNAEAGVDEAIKKRKIVLIANLLESAQKYIGIVVKQGFLLQVHEGANGRDILEELAVLDKSRSRTHDSLIHQIAIVNRLCEKYGLEPIYKGGDARRDKGDFALELVNDYFRERI